MGFGFCSGASIDSHARAPLWEVGLDYNHGTSHGVGYFLGVHESTGGDYRDGVYISDGQQQSEIFSQ